MSVDLRAPVTEFYRVSAKTFPFSEQTRKIIGYYLYKKTALLAAKIIQEHRGQKLSAGIDVFCDRFQKAPKNFYVAICKAEIDSEEQDRLLNLHFEETLTKRKIDFVASENISGKNPKTNRLPPDFITPSFNPEVAAQNFIKGVSLAQEYAQERYGKKGQTLTLTFRGAGICAMSVGPRTIDPIELQEITLIIEPDLEEDLPEYRKIGSVLPEKDHLFTLKTADEIRDEIQSLIDRFFTQDSKSL